MAPQLPPPRHGPSICRAPKTTNYPPLVTDPGALVTCPLSYGGMKTLLVVRHAGTRKQPRTNFIIHSTPILYKERIKGL